MSDFEVNCPHCSKTNDFTEDNWHDELIDESEDHEIACLHCKKIIMITVHAEYTLTADIPEED